MDGHSLSQQVIPRRQAAKAAAANLTKQLASSSESDSDGNFMKTKQKVPSSVTRKNSKRVKPDGAVNDGISTALDATLLSVVTPSIAPLPVSQATRPRPRPISKKFEGNYPEPEKNNKNISDLPSQFKDLLPIPVEGSASQASVSAHNANSSNPGSSQSNDLWKVTKLGTYVWVAITVAGSQIYDPLNEEVERAERMWWPGKIKSSKLLAVPLEVSLFHSKVKSVQVNNPCAENLLSKLTPLGQPRFKCLTLVSPSVSVLASPRKKQKRDIQEIEQAWEEGVKEMLAQEAEDASSDDLPDVKEAFNFAHLRRLSASNADKFELTTSHAKFKGKRKFKSDSEDDIPAVWIPAPPDDSIKIPGEIVFARDGPTAISYWPALVERYVPPKTSKQKQGKYAVVFLDMTRKAIPRSWFYTTDEDEFATCKLGTFKSDYQDVVNDDEDEGGHNTTSEDGRHSPSPVPNNHPPQAFDFTDLDIREQFAYTKPILAAILNEKYAPARRKHDLFISGGQGRKAVVDDAVLRGRMEPQSVSKLQKHLSQWCLRDNQRAQLLDDDEELTGFVESKAEAETDTQVEINNGSQRSVSPVGSEGDVPPPSSFSLGTDRASSAENELTAGVSSEVLFTSSIATLPTTISDGIEGSSFNSDTLSASLPRQRGCAAFETLAGVEKVDYCVNVLLPEAILQILLWRTGSRRSVELLPEEEEECLHKRGEELLKETDFVFDAMRLRGLKLRNLGIRTPKGKGGNTAGRTSTSRTKRNRVNYQE